MAKTINSNDVGLIGIFTFIALLATGLFLYEHFWAHRPEEIIICRSEGEFLAVVDNKVARGKELENVIGRAVIKMLQDRPTGDCNFRLAIIPQDVKVFYKQPATTTAPSSYK